MQATPFPQLFPPTIKTLPTAENISALAEHSPPKSLPTADIHGPRFIPRSHTTSVKPDTMPAESDNDNGTPAVPAYNSFQSGGENHRSRPLDTTDALNYLDAVKEQFHDKPDVYNHFLDIMTDFKGQRYVLFLVPPVPLFLRLVFFGSRWVEPVLP